MTSADRLVVHQLDAHHRGDRLAGEVVVGRPEPAADDDGVGLGEQARAASASMRPTLSPTFTWRQRGDAAGGQLLADPRRVGVDDLPEQQLGADGEDVTSHGPASRLGAAAGMRRRYCPAADDGEHDGHPQEPVPQPRGVEGGERQEGEADGELLGQRLVLGHPAGRHADTLATPTTVRYTLMTSSRAAMIATGTIQNTPLPTSVNIAPSTSTLSASGSRNAPDRGGAVAAGDVAVDAVAGAQHEPQRERHPRRPGCRRG